MTKLRFAGRTSVAALSLIGLGALTGCHGTPLFNILGSFFPAWMACLIAGIVLTLLVRWLFRRIDLERYIRPLVVVYPALVTLFTCTIWLLFFR